MKFGAPRSYNVHDCFSLLIFGTMIKLYSTVTRLSVLYGGTLRTNLKLQSFGNYYHGKSYFQTAAGLFDKSRDSKSLPEKHSEEDADEKKDVIEQSKILLIEKGKKVGFVTLDEAQHIAKARNRRLVKAELPGRRSNQEVYQLVTHAQLQQVDTQSDSNRVPKPKGSKGEKAIVISSKITDHDLGIKINSIKKWLGQKYIIRVTLNNDATNSAERIFEELQKASNEAGGMTSVKNKSSNGATLKVIFQYNNKSNVS